MGYLTTIPELAPLYEDADYIEEKRIEGETNLRRFAAGLMRRPPWLRALYALRAGLVRPFGIRSKHGGTRPLRPEDIPFGPGERCAGFTVACGREDEFLALYADDPHLKAYILIAAVPLPNGKTRFHVGTLVRFHNAMGPIYFSLIRPFHHVVVNRMMRAGVRA